MHLTYDAAELVRGIIAGWDPALYRGLILSDAKELAAYTHLGYVRPCPDVCGLIRESAAWAAEYFGRGKTSDKDGGWFAPLSYGMLLCLLVADRAALVRICSWARPAIRPEYKGPLEDEVQLLYLVMASLFLEKPDHRFEALRIKVGQCRKKNVRLLSQALNAIIARDEPTFAAAVEACVRHHMTKPRPSPAATFMEDWLPLHANTVYLAGLALGLKPPGFPQPVAGYLMTPESVGCAG